MPNPKGPEVTATDVGAGTDRVIRTQVLDASGDVVDTFGVSVEGGAGDASAANQATQIANEGAIADAAVAAGATGSINAHLRSISRDLVANVVLAAGTNNVGAVDPRGNVAHDGADSGNPVKVGGRARTALPTAVAQDDRSDIVTDKFGRQATTVAPLDQRTSGKGTFTDTAAADIIAAPGANIAIVVTSILVVNNHATVGTKVEIRDGTTVKLQAAAAAVGGGFQLVDTNGLFVATANTAVTARNVTTGADTDVFVSGYKIPA